jgi:hypothetical protein
MRLAYQFAPEVLHAVPQGTLKVLAEFFGDAFDTHEDIVGGMRAETGDVRGLRGET